MFFSRKFFFSRRVVLLSVFYQTFFFLRVVMDPRTTELIYGTRKTKGTKKINETLAGSEFFLLTGATHSQFFAEQL